jgi:hypothetical protein
LIEEKMEGKRTRVKKEVKVECGYNHEDIIPIDTQNKLRDEEIESRSKACQEQKLHLLKDEEENKVELARRIKEKSEEDRKKQEAKITRAHEVSNQCFDGLINMKSFEPLSLNVIKKTYPMLYCCMQWYKKWNRLVEEEELNLQNVITIRQRELETSK